ncbi:MAG: 30S ribosomal protein S24e [Candidatus Bathyarchaeia archaeon]
MTTTKENPLLGRKELTFKVVEPSTPERRTIRTELAEILDTDLANVYVRKVETKTGTRLTIGEAHIYNEKERALEVEPEYIIERNRIEEPGTQEEEEAE